MGTHWGKFTDSAERFFDAGKLPTSVAAGPSSNGPIRRTLICSYTGGNFVSERDDTGALNIYYISTGGLANVIGDRSPPCGCSADGSPDPSRMTAARMQAKSEELRAAGVWGKR